jgi:hypothetical protein
MMLTRRRVEVHGWSREISKLQRAERGKFGHKWPKIPSSAGRYDRLQRCSRVVHGGRSWKLRPLSAAQNVQTPGPKIASSAQSGKKFQISDLAISDLLLSTVALIGLIVSLGTDLVVREGRQGLVTKCTGPATSASGATSRSRSCPSRVYRQGRARDHATRRAPRSTLSRIAGLSAERVTRSTRWWACRSSFTCT